MMSPATARALAAALNAAADEVDSYLNPTSQEPS